MEIPEIIAGPCIIQDGDVYYESADAVNLKVTDENTEVRTQTRGKVGALLTGRRIEVTFTPVKWSDFSSLYRILDKPRGSLLFGKTNRKFKIWGADGVAVELQRSEIQWTPTVTSRLSTTSLFSFRGVRRKRASFSSARAALWA